MELRDNVVVARGVLVPRLQRSVAVVAALVAATASLTGCTTGEDAVAQGGTFDFVSPGGQTAIFYDPPFGAGHDRRSERPDLFTDEPIRLSDFTGKVVLINVWGSWCAPCRTETPELETVYGEYRDRGVQFVGIDVRDNRDTACDFVTDRNVQYPSIFDPSLRSLITLGTYLSDQRGAPHHGPGPPTQGRRGVPHGAPRRRPTATARPADHRALTAHTDGSFEGPVAVAVFICWLRLRRGRREWASVSSVLP